MEKTNSSLLVTSSKLLMLGMKNEEMINLIG